MCAAIVLGAGASIAAAAAGADEPLRSKLTVGNYRYDSGYSGQDVNYRWRADDTSWWVGAYRDRVFGHQVRTGFDTVIPLGDRASLQPSLQAASRGFVGGSVNLTLGAPYFVLVGWGRTNLKPYFNLNFDPNDAITVGAGWSGEGGRMLMASVVADDRLHTHQKDYHLYARWPLGADLRLTLDLLHKTGIGDGGPVRASGLSVTLDFPRWFIRIARDPKQSFTTEDATRISTGLRF